MKRVVKATHWVKLYRVLKYVVGSKIAMHWCMSIVGKWYRK
jgi:hypothetical protein